MGIPLFIACVASVLLNLWGCTLFMFVFCPSFCSVFSIPVIPRRLCGFLCDTNSAGLLSVLSFRYFCKCIFVFALKYTMRSDSPFPSTLHSLSCRFMSCWLRFTSSPTLIPVDMSSSSIAWSRVLFVLFLSVSRFSSVSVSFIVRPVFILCILFVGFFSM